MLAYLDEQSLNVQSTLQTTLEASDEEDAAAVAMGAFWLSVGPSVDHHLHGCSLAHRSRKFWSQNNIAAETNVILALAQNYAKACFCASPHHQCSQSRRDTKESVSWPPRRPAAMLSSSR